MNINLSIAPADSATVPTTVRRASVEVTYARLTPATKDEPAETFAQTERVELDAQLRGSALLSDAATINIGVRVLATDGSSLLERTLSANANNAASLELKKEDIALLAGAGGALPVGAAPIRIVRSARLVATGEVRLDHAGSAVLVSALPDLDALSTSGVKDLLQTDGTRTTSIEATGPLLSRLGAITWTQAHLAVDGTLTASFDQQRTLGWLWWLNGPRQLLGFVPDDLSQRATENRVIALPVLSKLPPTSPRPSKVDGCGRSVSADVTEKELANNPGIYTEDPGAFCKPFSNPERVLSEKSFAVIARITQPEIGAMGSIKTRGLALLNLDGEVSRTADTNSGVLNFIRSVVTTTAASIPSVALEQLAPPARHTLVARYADLLRRLPTGRRTMDASSPMQWEDDIAQYQAATVALGHILEFRVRWRSNGYSLGNVAKTLTLAPRQTKRIQKIEWERSERAVRRESTQLRDTENDSTVRERDYSDEVSANLSEWANGNSSSSTAAAAGGIGFFVPPVLGGIGGGAATARSSSHQAGGRDTTASEHQRLRDAIRRHGDALRKFESTVVNEVTQEETVTGTTEVIRNVNYAHSLTVIYYQILRHLKINTEFAGVRECLFVPFAIKPFDVQRAYRWRESIQASVRTPRFSRALRYLRDVATNFATSDIAAGSRARQPLTYLRGSIYVNLGVERPRDTSTGGFDDGLWRVVQPLLLSPALGIFSQLLGHNAADRDRVFQSEHAPGIAAQWANRINLRVGTRLLDADCTLATRYRFNGSVRIDFAIPASQLTGLTREALQQLTVDPGLGLPPGSVANLTRISLVYNTARFEHAVEGRTGTNDLVNAGSGSESSATVVVPLDHWERVDERLELRRTVQQLVEHLNEHVEYYHKAIWWRMDRDRLLMMLDGFYVPNTNGVSIASVVDREPVGIIGNCLVYRVGAASFLGYGKVTNSAELYNVYATKEPVADPVLVSLPTDGLYAQTIMDECNALEEHFGNTDWVLNDKEPELGSIDPSLLLTRRADTTTSTTPSAFPATIINLQNAPDAPAPSGLQGVLNAVTNPNAFRDMAGLAGTQANAAAALTTAANLATNFGNQAAGLELAKLAKAQEATRTADQKMASIKGAVDKGLANQAEASKAAQDVLAAMNPDAPKAQAPHENKAINAAIDSARSIPGSTIEANTGEGGVRIQVGADDAVFDDRTTRPFIVPTSVTGTAQNRAFNPKTREKTGSIKLSVRINNMPSGGSVRWSVPPSEAGHFSLAGGQQVQSGLSAVVTGLMPGLTVIDCELRDASGTVVESEKYPLCIPQFFAVGVDATTFTPILTNYGLVAFEIEEVLRVAKSVVDTVLEQTNVRSVWQMAPFNETLPAQFAAGGAAAANVTTVTLRGDPPSPGFLGLTLDRNGASVLVGPTFFDENIQLFAGTFDDPIVSGAIRDIDDVTVDVVSAIAAAGLTSSTEKNLAIEVLGRLYGETLAHEMIHSLIGGTLTGPTTAHNPSPGFTNDIMNEGVDRSFQDRTAFVIDRTQIGVVDLATLLADDRGISFINIPTRDAKTQLDANFPVPPTFA